MLVVAENNVVSGAGLDGEFSERLEIPIQNENLAWELIVIVEKHPYCSIRIAGHGIHVV